MNNGQENRRSFRIVESVFLDYETISDLDFNLGLERWRLSQGTSIGVRSRLLEIDARFNEKLFLLKSDSIALAECLHLLNQKITAIADEFPGLKESKSALVQQAPQSCEIGADGMSFRAAKQYPPDTKMVLRLLLASDSRYVETFCRVIRVDESSENSDSNLRFCIAVEFLGMTQEQKDILIQHLFDRESETLRMRRLELDGYEFDPGND